MPHTSSSPFPQTAKGGPGRKYHGVRPAQKMLEANWAQRVFCFSPASPSWSRPLDYLLNTRPVQSPSIQAPFPLRLIPNPAKRRPLFHSSLQTPLLHWRLSWSPTDSPLRLPTPKLSILCPSVIYFLYHLYKNLRWKTQCLRIPTGQTWGNIKWNKDSNIPYILWGTIYNS